MVFRIDKRIFESEKERNLYYKFFAGFYFNELIPGFQSRISDFYRLLKNPVFSVGDLHIPSKIPQLDEVYVSFDNHPDRFIGAQSGEFADILIHDASNNLLVGIEAKYRDDWEYQKDIVSNEERLNYVATRLEVLNTVLCLLITEEKWRNVVAMEGHPQSNYRKLCKHTGKAVVILWDSFLEIESVNYEVKKYLGSRLAPTV